jgi:hypothetical protein
MKPRFSSLAEEIEQAIKDQPKPEKLSERDFYLSVAQDWYAKQTPNTPETAITYAGQSFCIVAVLGKAFERLATIKKEFQAPVTAELGFNLVIEQRNITDIIVNIVRTFLDVSESNSESSLKERRAILIYSLVEDLDMILSDADKA